MIIIVGPSASGKTELAKILCNKYGYEKCITTTTRAIREGEIADISYHFVSHETFTNLKDHDAFVEVNLYQNNWYGLQKKDLKPNSLIIVDPNGANALLKNIEEQPFVIFMQTNIEIRKQRMIERKDKEKDIIKRLAKDEAIFKEESLNHIDLILNNNQNSLEDLAKIVIEKLKK